MKITVQCYDKTMKYETADGMTIDDCIETFKLLMSFFTFTPDQIKDVFGDEDLIAITDERDSRDMRIKELEAENEKLKGGLNEFT